MLALFVTSPQFLLPAWYVAPPGGQVLAVMLGQSGQLAVSVPAAKDFTSAGVAVLLRLSGPTADRPVASGVWLDPLASDELWKLDLIGEALSGLASRGR